MKKLIYTAAIIFSLPFGNGLLFSQCLPMIKIDGNKIIADENQQGGIKLPSWLKATQSLDTAQFVYSISVIEFTVNGTALDYSQNLSVTTTSTVPAGKIWKIESIHKDPSVLAGTTTTYSSAGSYTYIPTCSGNYNIKVWGGGGAGGSEDCCGLGFAGAGGGGGGYAEGNYYLTAGTSYTVTVGAGGTSTWPGSGAAGGTSSVSSTGISASGGSGGSAGGGASVGGVGGMGSGGSLNYKGQTGGQNLPSIPSVTVSIGGNGGNCAYIGGSGGVPNIAGSSPGGGGGGDSYGGVVNGGAGAEGKVIISSATTNIIATPKVPCVTLYIYTDGYASPYPAACPNGWIDLGYGKNSVAVSTSVYYTYCRTCYKCD